MDLVFGFPLTVSSHLITSCTRICYWNLIEKAVVFAFGVMDLEIINEMAQNQRGGRVIGPVAQSTSWLLDFNSYFGFIQS